MKSLGLYLSLLFLFSCVTAFEKGEVEVLIPLGTNIDDPKTFPVDDELPTFGDYNYILTDPSALVFSPLNSNDAYFFDSKALTLFYINTTTGNISIVSNLSRGSGPAINFGGAISINSLATMAYVINNQNEIYSINLISGNRALVSSDARGAGTSFNAIVDLKISNTDDYLYAVDTSSNSKLFLVEISTGDRTVISDSSVGSGVNLIGATFLLLDSTNSNAFVACHENFSPYNSFISKVDLVSGNRTIISNGAIGSGSPYERTYGMSGNENDLQVLSRWDEQIININTITGDRTVLATLDAAYRNLTSLVGDPNKFFYTREKYPEIYQIDLSGPMQSTLATGRMTNYPNLGAPGSLAVNASGSRIYFADYVLDQISEYNTITDEIRILSDNSNSGPLYNNYHIPRIVLNSTDTEIFYVDMTDEKILKVNVATGDKELLVDISAGIGLDYVVGIALSPDNSRLYIFSGSQNALYSINTTTGATNLISNNSGTGSGDNFSSVGGIVINKTGDTAYITNNAFSGRFISSVNLSNGDRTVISSSVIGTGDDLVGIRKIDISEDGNLLYVSNEDGKSLLSVEIATGNRSTISNSSIGLGNALDIYSFTKHKGSEYIFIGNNDGFIRLNLANGNRFTFAKWVPIIYE